MQLRARPFSRRLFQKEEGGASWALRSSVPTQQCPGANQVEPPHPHPACGEHGLSLLPAWSWAPWLGRCCWRGPQLGMALGGPEGHSGHLLASGRGATRPASEPHQRDCARARLLPAPFPCRLCILMHRTGKELSGAAEQRAAGEGAGSRGRGGGTVTDEPQRHAASQDGTV